jgi:hypothetical protein
MGMSFQSVSLFMRVQAVSLLEGQRGHLQTLQDHPLSTKLEDYGLISPRYVILATLGAPSPYGEGAGPRWAKRG